MIEPKYSTNLELKKKHFDAFIELVRDQFIYGGIKYAQGDKKEATDLICEAWGMEWRFGEMNKRLLRFKNIQKEKDILKLACECYLVWLQMGFFKNKKHNTDTYKK